MQVPSFLIIFGCFRLYFCALKGSSPPLPVIFRHEKAVTPGATVVGWRDDRMTSQDHAYIYVVSEPYFGGDLMTCAQRASENGVALNQHWLAGILRQVCAPLARVVVHFDTF